MITHDDTNDDNGYARVKRWREKNRAYVNLKQKEYRRKKKNLGGSGKQPCKHGLVGSEDGLKSGIVQPNNDPPPSLPFETKKVGELRMIVLQEEEKHPTEAPVSSGRPVVYRNDYGGVISKMAWEKLQKLKEDAKSGGYELDEYSQGVK